MSFSRIQFEREGGGIAVITINRPDKRNALDAATMDELAAAFAEVAQSADIKGLIVTGAGGKAFAAGADIAELANLPPAGFAEYARRGQAILRRLETLGKPSIAALNGVAFGGGLELALAATLRVASSNAKLGLPEVVLGTIPGWGGAERLVRLIGRGRAVEMLLTGTPLDAGEARLCGLVNHVVEPAELPGFCRELLGRILRNAPIAVRLAMEAVDRGGDAEGAAFGQACATRDFREGVAAFLEKRKPVFTGS